ncbi:MAG: response regulator [Armatimonadetes bacterium]|nr:response regulator [Armatimonadota bacterium]
MEDNLQGRRILVFDDEPHVRHGVRLVLERSGLDVVTAETGEQAIELAESVQPELIILDIISPHREDELPHRHPTEGIEVCRAIKGNARTRDIPVIMLSVKGEVQDREMAAQAGANDYMTKPFNSSELLERVQKHLK